MDDHSIKSQTDQVNWRTWTFRFIAAVLLFRIIYLYLFPLSLVHDEAYYWDWSRNLDWGYYSKPPMIAWIIAASTRLLGSSEFTVRLPAAILSSLGLSFIYLLSEKMFSPKVGFWAVLLSAFTPGNVAMGLLMTIDAPFIFLWSASLYCFWNMLQRDENRTKWLLLTMCCIGLGVLTKQTMLGFLAFGGIFVLISAEDRKEVLKPGLWLCALGSLLFLTPVLLWNWQHDWITAQHTSEHFQSESVSLYVRLMRSLEFTGGLLGVISPITFILIVGVSIAGLWSIRHLGRKEKYLLCFSALPLAIVFLLSFKQRIELNWPAAFFAAAIILAVAWAENQTAIQWSIKPKFKLLRNAAIVGACFSVITYAMPFAIDALALQGSKIDPVVRLRGWNELGEKMTSEIEKLSIADDAMYVVTDGRTLTAEMSFYLENRPKIYLWKNSSDVTSQYDVWGGPSEHKSRQAVILTAGDREVPSAFAASFDSIKLASTVTVPINESRKLNYKIWIGENCHSWPANGTTVVAENNSGEHR